MIDISGSKKFFLDQHGCAKNQVDGELMIFRLQNMGYSQTFDADEADLIVVNSCGFIESAKKESLEAVCSAKKSYPNAKILLAGCLAERYASVFKTSLPEADAVFGNGDISRLDEIVKAIERNERPVAVYRQEGVCCGERRTLLGFRGSAFVKITEGCSNHCSFCAIPLIRGELRSRPAKKIVEEIAYLVENGVFEINLIGQDLAAYGLGSLDNVFEKTPSTATNDSLRSPLSLLLEMITLLPHDFRLRLLYIHPDHFNEDILPVMRGDRRLLPYFDIPFQSGDDSVIRAMNRKGSARIYESLVRKIRLALPDAVIRTTFLTGFPGETEENALNTEKFLRSIRTDWSGCFPYSREEDTPAYDYGKRVPLKTAKARAESLQKIQADITKDSLASRVGTELDVLVEEIVEGNAGLAIGRAWFQASDVDGSVVIRYDSESDSERIFVKPGALVRVRITGSGAVDLDSVFLSSVKTPIMSKSGKLEYVTELSKA